MNVYKISDYAVRHFVDWTEASEVIEDMRRAHWKETESAYRGGHYCPDHDIYKLCHDLREAFTIVAYFHGKPIAYAIMLISDELHMSGSFAYDDSYYVTPKHRGRGVLDILLNASEAVSEHYGVGRIVFSDKLFDMRSFFERKGYTQTTRLYSKLIGE